LPVVTQKRAEVLAATIGAQSLLLDGSWHSSRVTQLETVPHPADSIGWGILCFLLSLAALEGDLFDNAR